MHKILIIVGLIMMGLGFARIASIHEGKPIPNIQTIVASNIYTK